MEACLIYMTNEIFFMRKQLPNIFFKYNLDEQLKSVARNGRERIWGKNLE